MRRRLIAGNWKMNGSAASARALLQRLAEFADDSKDVVVFPPMPYLSLAIDGNASSRVGTGAQNCAAYEQGAYTGEVSASMIADLGARHVLVGHSERRALFAENDATVLAKVQQALAAKLTVYVCVGETLAQRRQDQQQTVVAEQLQALIAELPASAWSSIVVAYEPVWAIGTGETATPEQAQAMHAFIRSQLQQVSPDVAEQTRILYGGSVKAANAAELFSQPDIDGGLVGGASLDAEEFLAICHS
ncbi:triose-phosphate isomerase [Bacterioplanes sanyensis]|uniref:Triosephosphate isomerase n=1 Tax=Bacterioplanes sanyensis TaxID=1249553 RepID=A0A222FER6_9GAMM|nr:triose-phosphate isomerase [Bacterioplanes sanyensis]ASP37250.1 triose-phosphate isomerase [Bacterioplanes sanyensis]